MPKTKWYSNPYHDEIYQAQKQKEIIEKLTKLLELKKD